MATIASNVFLGAGAASTGATADEAPASGSPGDFMQLVQGMIQGNTPGDQLPSNLLELLLTGDTGGLDGILDAAGAREGDSKTDGSDDDGSDEAAAMAGLAALLAGLQPTPVAGAADGGDAGVASIDGAGSQKGDGLQALQLLLGKSEAALSAAVDAMNDAS